MNSTDALIEQAGFEPGVQLHYAGDVPRLKADAAVSAEPWEL
ncbi:hypothetical protein [Streptomyces sp. NPDC001675]